MPSPLSFVVVAFIVLLVYRVSKIGRRPSGCPPGPPTLPLIGNLHLMPRGNPHLQFQKWAKEYGPVYSLVLGMKIMIVLNTDQAVKDLLDKKRDRHSASTSHAPRMRKDSQTSLLGTLVVYYWKRARILRPPRSLAVSLNWNDLHVGVKLNLCSHPGYASLSRGIQDCSTGNRSYLWTTLTDA